MILNIICLLHLKTEPKCVQTPKFWPLNGLHWPYNLRPRLKMKLNEDITHIYPHTKFERSKQNVFKFTTH